jgi:hypothetical protein
MKIFVLLLCFLLVSSCASNTGVSQESTSEGRVETPSGQPLNESESVSDFPMYMGQVPKCWTDDFGNLEPNGCFLHDYEVISSGRCSNLQDGYEYFETQIDFSTYCLKSVRWSASEEFNYNPQPFEFFQGYWIEGYGDCPPWIWEQSNSYLYSNVLIDGRPFCVRQ